MPARERAAPHSRRQGTVHQARRIHIRIEIGQTEGVAEFVHHDGEQIDAIGRRASGRRSQFASNHDGAELVLGRRRRIDEPTRAGGVIVEGDVVGVSEAEE